MQDRVLSKLDLIHLGPFLSQPSTSHHIISFTVELTVFIMMSPKASSS